MLKDGADLQQGQAVAGEDTRAALGDGAAWLRGFPFLVYILQSPGTRGLGGADWRDATAPL